MILWYFYSAHFSSYSIYLNWLCKIASCKLISSDSTLYDLYKYILYSWSIIIFINNYTNLSTIKLQEFSLLYKMTITKVTNSKFIFSSKDLDISLL